MNADIAYIMSCSDDEFQQVTGVRLPEDAWDRWSDDMDKRTNELLALFEKAVAAEREACAKYLGDQNTAMTDKLAAEIRARSKI